MFCHIVEGLSYMFIQFGLFLTGPWCFNPNVFSSNRTRKWSSWGIKYWLGVSKWKGKGDEQHCWMSSTGHLRLLLLENPFFLDIHPPQPHPSTFTFSKSFPNMSELTAFSSFCISYWCQRTWQSTGCSINPLNIFTYKLQFCSSCSSH